MGQDRHGEEGTILILAEFIVNSALVVSPVRVATVREPPCSVAMDAVPPLKVVGFVLFGIIANTTIRGNMFVFSRRHLEVQGFLGSGRAVEQERIRAGMQKERGTYHRRR